MSEITYTTKKYKILQKTSATTADIMHPETEAVITLIKPFDDITGPNTQKALEQLDKKINIAQSTVLFDTKEGWNSKLKLISQPNTIYVYTDAFTYNDGTQDVTVAGIKVGDGNAYLIDKAFITDKLSYQIGELIEQFQNHLADNTRHINNEERAKWNAKLNCEDIVVNETLILNRN